MMAYRTNTVRRGQVDGSEAVSVPYLYFVPTFDVEDWFQVQNLRSVYPLSTWAECELRVVHNTHHILNSLDGIAGTVGAAVRGTFFVLGWIAKRCPELVREIRSRGHELASHGYSHELCTELSGEALVQDLQRSKWLLEDLSGGVVRGYRAPSFSVCPGLFPALDKAGYQYDSSYNSFALHQRYGHLDVRLLPRRGIGFQISSTVFELPVSNLQWAGHMWPWAGGGYFRLYPERLFHWGVGRILRREAAYIFYMHPWEVDPDQPRAVGLKAVPRLKHYVHLETTLSRLEHLLLRFRQCRFVSCWDYIQSVTAGMT